MKIGISAAFSASFIALCACSKDPNPTGSQSASGRIEAGLIGTWVDNTPFIPDTLIFAEDKIEVPFFSAVGSSFSAKNGLVKGEPDDKVYGEYLLSGDTLYYDVLFPDAPNGVDKATAAKYRRQ